MTLTISNVRKDIGHDIGFEFGAYKLIDGGLSSERDDNTITLEYPYYTFYWAFSGGMYEERTVKVVLKRNPVVQNAEYRHLFGIHYSIEFYKRVKDISISNPVKEWEKFWVDVVSRDVVMDAGGFYIAMINIMERERKQWYIEK